MCMSYKVYGRVEASETDALSLFLKTYIAVLGH